MSESGANEGGEVRTVMVTSPSQGQVTKALYQFLSQMGVSASSLEPIIQKKAEEAIIREFTRLIDSKRFDALIVAAVMAAASEEKKSFEPCRYGGWLGRVRQLVVDALQKELIANLSVKVEMKNTPASNLELMR